MSAFEHRFEIAVLVVLFEALHEHLFQVADGNQVHVKAADDLELNAAVFVEKVLTLFVTEIFLDLPDLDDGDARRGSLEHRYEIGCRGGRAVDADRFNRKDHAHRTGRKHQS